MDETTAIIVTPKRYTMGQIASQVDEMAKAVVLKQYHDKTAAETLRRHYADLDSFKKYLDDAHVDCDGLDLMNDLSAWEGVSFGLIEGYKEWMLKQGYSIGTINVRLATVKKYIAMAVSAGYVSQQSHALILQIKGFRPVEGRNRDEKREITRHPNGHKKARHTLISIEDAEALKNQADPRDRLLMCLLIDHGFRCGEIAALRVSSVNMSTKQVVVYRHKVDKEGTQDLSKDTYAALVDYLALYAPTNFLFIGDCNKEGLEGSYGVRAINKRAGALGKQAGIDNLSPHDLRHFWAWYAAYRGIPINRLKQAGGWTSLEMPVRYIGKSEVENEGMV